MSAPLPLILLVEDDPDLREMISTLLVSRSYRVASCSDGREALDWLQHASERPSVILLDLMMPGMDGPMFREAQLADPLLASLRVIVLSAQPDIEVVAERMAVNGWLRKPPSIHALFDMIHRVTV